MTEEIEVRESEVLVVPVMGTAVNLNEPREAAIALQDIRHLEGEFRDVKRVLVDALVAYWQRGGTAKTFDVDDARKVEITGGPSKTYDAEAIRDELLAAGMPERRVEQIVVETITYSVKAIEANRAARANPEYAAIIERNTVVLDAAYNASVKRR